MNRESAIRICAQLYEQRDTCRSLLGDQYKTRTANFAIYIREAMKKWNLEPIPALMRLLTALQEKPGTDIEQITLTAALVEMLEPSDK